MRRIKRHRCYNCESVDKVRLQHFLGMLEMILMDMEVAIGTVMLLIADRTQDMILRKSVEKTHFQRAEIRQC